MSTIVWANFSKYAFMTDDVYQAWRKVYPDQDVGYEPLVLKSEKDAAYLERNQVIAALARCFPSGVARTAIEGWSKDWHGCVYIDLPTGQASWHFHDSHAHLFAGLPAYTGEWDGHTTDEKYARLAELTQTDQQELRETVKHLATALAEEVNGPTFMGEPVLPVSVNVLHESPLDLLREILPVLERLGSHAAKLTERVRAITKD